MPQEHPINIQAIDHVVIRVQNLDRMTRFYCDVLGCRLEKEPGDAGLAALRAGASLIDLVDANGPLGTRGGEPPNHRAPNMDHLCLQVQPWVPDDITEHLAKNDVDFGEIATRYGALGNGPSLYLSDPEGNTVELKGPGPGAEN